MSSRLRGCCHAQRAHHIRIAQIARAHPRLCALALGAEDFATPAGIVPDAEGLFTPEWMAGFAARAAGIMPLGFIGTVAELHDLDGFRQTIRRSRRLGFIGASVIHPGQVPILNKEFRASPEEVDHARRVVAAYDKALAEGIGAWTLSGFFAGNAVAVADVELPEDEIEAEVAADPPRPSTGAAERLMRLLPPAPEAPPPVAVMPAELTIR